MQIVKLCVFGVVLLPLRLLVAFICITLAGCLAMIGLAGLKPGDIDQAPFTGWRLLVRKLICFIIRFMYICVGFIVRVKGEQARAGEAPILVVAPHSTFFDSLAVVLMGAPSVVAKAETTSIPFWGAIIQMSQPVLVLRTDPNSRENTIKNISDRAEGALGTAGWQQVLIFPEGTCTNRQRLITFRVGGFLPGVPVQPVTIRYDNLLDTVTWTWEGITAWWVIVYTLSQLYTNCTVEFLPPYVPDQEEKEDPKKFAGNVRDVMAKSLGVQTTDCSYFDYLKIEKCHKVLKKLQKLQRHLDMSMLELTKEISSDEKVTEDILSKVNALSDSEDISVVEELCGSLEDLRNLKLIALIATDQNSVQSFLENAFKLYDSDLGGNAVSNETMERILQTVMFLNPKESKEVVEATSKNTKVEKIDLEEYLNTRKPNYVKVKRNILY